MADGESTPNTREDLHPHCQYCRNTPHRRHQDHQNSAREQDSVEEFRSRVLSPGTAGNKSSPCILDLKQNQFYKLHAQPLPRRHKGWEKNVVKNESVHT